MVHDEGDIVVPPERAQPKMIDLQSDDDICLALARDGDQFWIVTNPRGCSVFARDLNIPVRTSR